MTDMRVGYGYDVHKIGMGRTLMLGGVEIEGADGLVGHSDADVLLHALSDALVGAAGLGDIGEHFPDTDARFKDEASSAIARHLMGVVADRGFSVVNADVTVVTEEPPLHPYTERIRTRIAEILRVRSERVNVKAKTKEGLDAVGEGRAMEAHAVVLLMREEA